MKGPRTVPCLAACAMAVAAPWIGGAWAHGGPRAEAAAAALFEDPNKRPH